LARFGREGESYAAIERNMGWVASLSLAEMRTSILFALLLLGGCHKDQPPMPTAEQSNQLNDAEQMLNDMARNEEGPEANASGPSNSSD
jgi:hypothetical protein